MAERLPTVSELLEEVSYSLEDRFLSVELAAEIGQFTRAQSGHLYLTLKDSQAALKAVMFRFQAKNLRFAPKPGDKVRARGTLTIYAPRGDLQLRLQSLVPDGEGDLLRRLADLKLRLEAEGLFAPERKRPWPRFPRRLALVTSPKGAALRDMLKVIRRRAPWVSLVLVPTPVQGATAHFEIASALDQASDLEVDGILLARGGGSLEDLWSFQEEAVARAVYRARHPVLTGVGHETDTTLVDFVSDLRAATPSAAAEQAVPAREQELARIEDLGLRLRSAWELRRSRARETLERMGPERLARLPVRRLQEASQRIDELGQRMRRAHNQRSTLARTQLEVFSARLRAADPAEPLRRGFALIQSPSGEILTRAEQLSMDQEVELRFQDGSRRARVDSKLLPPPPLPWSEPIDPDPDPETP